MGGSSVLHCGALIGHVGWLVGLRHILHSGYEHNGSFALTAVISFYRTLPS